MNHQDPFVLQDFNVAPGEKQRAVLTVADCPFRMPATVIRGVQPGPTLLVTAGVHNMEFVGINAAIQLANDTRPEDIANDQRNE